jgi:hypothetical protein
MTRPQYIFGRTKVHPEPPALDPAVAPWSAPRGYATTIPEEVAAYKASIRAGKSTVRIAGGPAAPLPAWHKAKRRFTRIETPNCFKRLADHFRAIGQDLAANLRFNKHKFIAKLCCLHAELD